MNSNKNYQAITCPICGSKEIAFVPEYHKCILFRIIKTICLVALIVIGLFYIPNLINNTINQTLIILAIINFILYLGLETWIKINEEKTHIKAICRNCSNIWQID